jgi:hypothetical protein
MHQGEVSKIVRKKERKLEIVLGKKYLKQNEAEWMDGKGRLGWVELYLTVLELHCR